MLFYGKCVFYVFFPLFRRQGVLRPGIPDPYHEFRVAGNMQETAEFTCQFFRLIISTLTETAPVDRYRHQNIRSPGTRKTISGRQYRFLRGTYYGFRKKHGILCSAAVLEPPHRIAVHAPVRKRGKSVFKTETGNLDTPPA